MNLVTDLAQLLKDEVEAAVLRHRNLPDQFVATNTRGPVPGSPSLGEMFRFLMESAIRNQGDASAVREELKASLRRARLAHVSMQRIFGAAKRPNKEGTAP